MKKRPQFKVPNASPTRRDFLTEGGFELWKMLMDMWYRLGRLEMAVAIGGSLLLGLAGAITGRVFELW